MTHSEEYSLRYETNPLTREMRERIEQATEEVYWADKRLKSIDRLRLLTDDGCPVYDVSYCYGTLEDGSPVRVRLPFGQLTKKRWISEIIKYAKEDYVYAKGLGIFDAVSILR